MPRQENHYTLNCRGERLDASSGQVHVMGILNVTPDSFSDGGHFLAIDAARARAMEMVEQGARIVDVGGASSRPAGAAYGKGAARVPVEEELKRVLPVIEAIQDLPTLISVDTFEPRVARACLEAGAHIVNDITGLRHDPDLAGVAAEYGAPLILMHSVGEAGAMLHETEDTDVVGTVERALLKAVEVAEAAGVRDIALDPGFGFGKKTGDNLALIARVDRLVALGRPVLIGISRKSSIGRVLGTEERPVPIEDRLFGTLGATAVGVMRGASIVRTHDVAATTQMLSVLKRTLDAGDATSAPIPYHPAGPRSTA